MTTITVLPEVGPEGGRRFRAAAGDKSSVGRTLGEALDSLTPQLGDGDMVVLLRRAPTAPDRFFGEEQRARLSVLMARWRSARDGDGPPLTPEEQAELERLADEELEAAGRRAGALADSLGPPRRLPLSASKPAGE